MNTDEFRAALTALGVSQGGFSRLLTALGDPASPMTIRRRIERWAQGASAIPGEAAALVNLLLALRMAGAPTLYPLADLARAEDLLRAAGLQAAVTPIEEYLMDQNDEAWTAGEQGLPPGSFAEEA